MIFAAFVAKVDRWETIECERVLYVDFGRTIVLCDRLPSPVTLVLKRKGKTEMSEATVIDQANAVAGQEVVPVRQMNLEVIAARPMGLGQQFLPRTFRECIDFAQIMAKSDFAIPPKFRMNPGACLAVTIQSCRWGADPFGVVQKAYITKSKDGSERLAYEAQLVAAVVNTQAPIAGRIQLVYSGAGPTRKVKVIGKFLDDPEPRELETPEVQHIVVKNSPLWASDPDQQLSYYGQRAWGRRWCPEVLLGIYTPEELAADVPVDRPTREQFTQSAISSAPSNEKAKSNGGTGASDQGEKINTATAEAVSREAPSSGSAENGGTAAASAPPEGEQAQGAAVGQAAGEAPGGLPAGQGDQEAESAAEKNGREMLGKVKATITSGEFDTDMGLDAYSARMKVAIAGIEGMRPDLLDDLRGQLARMVIEEKQRLAKRRPPPRKKP